MCMLSYSVFFYVHAGLSSDDERIFTDFQVTWQNSDCMKLSVNKLVYMFSIARPEQYTDLCIAFSRYRTKLGDWDYVKQVMCEKQTREYLDFEYHTETKEYMRKGYYSSNVILDDCNKIVEQNTVLDNNPIGETSEHYLRKTIEYCQEREIPITLFISPTYELQLISTGNYDNYIDQVRVIAEEYDVDFYDFNLIRKEYLPIQNGDYFMDIGHLNDAGANMFTPFFYEVVSSIESDNDIYFYDSYAEKLQDAAPEIYGIYYRDLGDATEGEEPIRTYWVASNRDSDIEYRIIVTPNEGEQYMIQDFSENKEFAIPTSETGICTVVARMKETSEDVQTLEINY